MTEDQQTVTAAPAPDPAPEQRPPLERSTDHRVVAGVCGGLGRHLDIDPLVFRVVIAVLCLWGGVGLFLYGMAWLIVPVQGTGRNELQRLLSGRVDGQSLGAVLVTVLGTGIFFNYMGARGHLFPLLLIGLLAFAALRYDPAKHRRPPVPPEPPQDAPPPSVPGWWQRPDPMPKAEVTAPVDPLAKATVPTGAASSEATTGETTGGTTEDAAPDAVEPPSTPGRRRRGRGWLGPLFTLLAIGAATWTAVYGNRHDGHVNTLAVLAAALGTLGVGIMLGSLWGRPRGLVALAAVLSAATIVVGAAPWAWEKHSPRVTWAPTSATDLADSYQLGNGTATLDLRALAPGQGHTLVTRVHLGAGSLRVLLPAAPEAVISAKVGVGEVHLPDGSAGGLGSSRTADLNPTGSTANGTLSVDVEVGAGTVEVERG
ncbi:PspC domain-containing protein [Streptacidiphilus monticola]|uniref:PspC domain-containing protein n=1 Tax=Streptacidiphilus monticola TaxID=2161674 RepID=A0ABW1FWP3_9ACTN